MRVSTVLFMASFVGFLMIGLYAFLFTEVYNAPVVGMFVCNMVGMFTGYLFGKGVLARRRGD